MTGPGQACLSTQSLRASTATAPAVHGVRVILSPCEAWAASGRDGTTSRQQLGQGRVLATVGG